jgi:hypothetical protein
MNLKLNTLLAKTDHLASVFSAMVRDFTAFFSRESGAFRGEKKTYSPAPGTQDDPSKRGNKLVVTTVNEKLDWFEKNSKEYIDLLFSQEATNAAGVAKAELKVGGTSWGTFTSLELLRLKSLIENGQLEQMYTAIPTRKDDEEWAETSEEQYKERAIFESPRLEGESKSIEKESYILPDPNLEKAKAGAYAPTLGQKNTVVKLGDYTFQKFSGEWTAREKAELLRRRTLLLNAVIEALKIANEAEVIKSELTAEKIFNYLHNGD